MKIVEKDLAFDTTFEDISIGEVFMHYEGVFMKVRPFYESSSPEILRNAINLASGKGVSFVFSEGIGNIKVRRVIAELNILKYGE